MKIHTRLTLTLVLITMIILSACGNNKADLTPTVSVEILQTQAVQTYSAGLTQTALAIPATSTPVPVNTPIPTITLSSGENTPVGPTEASASCLGLVFVEDITIDDNTRIQPGEKFTKTWLVKNSGNCNWESGYQFRHIGGDPLNGVTYTLPQVVSPNSQIEISIEMTAPTTPGSYQSSWKMYDPTTQAFFGESPWVLIVVGDAGTPSPTGTAPTATPTTQTP
ncbi:MAG: hypothetical protein JXA13_01860 [Anaerolineales bacterium]|nr:hypothetical protein [Anaerolineales bacterium]